MLSKLVRQSAVSVTGLRLRDGAFVVRVARGPKVEQVKVIEEDTFDPVRCGLVLVTNLDGFPPTNWARVENLADITFPRLGSHSGTPRGSGW